MIGINDVMEVLEQISLEVQRLPARIKIAANQVTVVTGLSDISKRLGLVSAGEFRSGNEKEPGFGFSGVRIGYPPFSYNSEDWSIVGINNDTLQFGINAEDGKAYFGGGAAIIDVDGITLPEGDVSAPIADTSALKWENENGHITSYIQNARAISDTASSLITSVRSLTALGAVNSFVQTQGYAYDNGDSSYSVIMKTGGIAFMHFTQDADGEDYILLDYGSVIINFQQLDRDFIVYGDNGRVLQVNAGLDRVEIMNLGTGAVHILDGAGTSYFNEPNADVDYQWEGVNSSKVLFFDSSADKLTSLAWDGWTDMSHHTWTRTGNHTFTVAGDVTAAYSKGAKVRYKDGGAYEYGVIASSSYGAPNTTVTLITNSDYAMAAATITDRYLSYIENPEGWPDWFNYAASFSASGSMTYTSVTIDWAIWRVVGKTLEFKHRAYGTLGGTASSTVYISSPTVINLSQAGVFVSTILDVSPTTVGRGQAVGGSALLGHLRQDMGNWTLGANKYIIGEGSYPL